MVDAKKPPVELQPAKADMDRPAQGRIACDDQRLLDKSEKTEAEKSIIKRTCYV